MLGKKFSLGSVVEETGEARIKLANFGGWLRISLDGNSKAVITSYLALKG